jgi:ceramide glucosyltransferase
MLFTYPIPIALGLVTGDFHCWPGLLAALLFRFAAAWSTSVWVLGVQPRWLLLPIQDLLSFAIWLAGFFGNTIIWRGRRYYLYPDGRFELRA